MDKWCIIVNRVGMDVPCSIMGPYNGTDEAIKARKDIDTHGFWARITRMDESAPK